VPCYDLGQHRHKLFGSCEIARRQCDWSDNLGMDQAEFQLVIFGLRLVETGPRCLPGLMNAQWSDAGSVQMLVGTSIHKQQPLAGTRSVRFVVSRCSANR
jgi:hypothetical protein